MMLRMVENLSRPHQVRVRVQVQNGRHFLGWQGGGLLRYQLFIGGGRMSLSMLENQYLL
jgi:hypothetical protein